MKQSKRPDRQTGSRPGIRRAVRLLISAAAAVLWASQALAAAPADAIPAGALISEAPAQIPVGPEVSAPSALLMEASTGEVIYEKNADEPRSPASITKIMTLILIFDALENGTRRLEDELVTRAYD